MKPLERYALLEALAESEPGTLSLEVASPPAISVDLASSAGADRHS